MDDLINLTNFTAEQLAIIEEAKKLQEIRTENLQAEIAAKVQDQNHALEVLRLNTRSECVQNAVNILTENSRTKPADESDVTPEAITALANQLYSYITAAP
jgi:hypothetical protein